MRAKPGRAFLVAAAAIVSAVLVASLPEPPADAAGVPLTTSEVTDLVERCVAYSRRAHGKPKLAIAVVDVEGNSLGVFRMAGLPSVPGDPFDPADNAVAAALAKAGTAAYFSSDDQTFTTRTATFIIQDHFPPGVRFQPGGPLYGVEFSSIASSDVNRVFYPPFPALRGNAEAETRVRGDLGGVGIYKNGRRVGGLGIDDGDLKKRISIPPVVFPGPDCHKDYRLTFKGLQRGRVLEKIVMAAARGRLAPQPIRSDKILVGGIRLDYSRGSDLPATKIKPLTPADGDWDPDFPLRPAVLMTSRFTDFTLDPPSDATPEAQSFQGQIPVAFPIRSSLVPGGLSDEEVRRILWQGAQRANITRAAIRRPIGLPMQCWVSVVDTTGEVLGVFRFQDDATLFSYDVSVQKARTAMFFSDEDAAFSSRAIGLFAQGFYPAGQQGAGRGPLFQVQDGLTVGLLGGAFGGPVAPAELAKIRNGITIFPGGVPLYRGGVLVGGVGVSGDGVDQDDIVADYASRGYGADREIRCDGLNDAQVKAALTRALDRLEAAAGPDPGPGVCGTGLPLAAPAMAFFQARLTDAIRTLRQTELEVSPPYTRFPRHPGPVTIRR